MILTIVKTGIKLLENYKFGIISKGYNCPYCDTKLQLEYKTIKNTKIHTCFACNNCGFRAPIGWNINEDRKISGVYPEYSESVNNIIRSIGEQKTYKNMIKTADDKIGKIKDYSG